MNVGILIQTWGPNQISHEITLTLNELGKDNYKDHYVVFFENMLNAPFKVIAPHMNICDFWSFSGNIIFTKLDQFSLLKNAVKPSKKIFYVQDLEWFKNLNYEENYKIYNSVDKLVCRSQYHAEALEKYCNRKPEVDDLCSLINKLNRSSMNMKKDQVHMS